MTPEQQTWPRCVVAAARVGLSPQRVRDLITAGRVAAVKDGREWRVDPGSLAAYVARRKGRRGRLRAGETL